MAENGPVRKVSAEDFAAHCLELIDEVAARGSTLVVTRADHPAVKVIPAETMNLEAPSLLGTVTYHISDDELVHFSTEDDWEALP